MGILVVQHRSAQTNGATSTSLAYLTNPTAGNLLVGDGVGAQAGTITVSSTNNGTWSNAVTSSGANSGGKCQISYKANCAGGADTVTASMSSGTDQHLHIYEVSGIQAITPLDKTGSASTGANANPGTVSTSGATTSANEYVHAVFLSWNLATTWTLGGSYTDTETTNNTNGGDSVFTEDLIVAATGTQTAQATSATTLSNYDAAIATFIAAAAGGGGAKPVWQMPVFFQG